MQIFHMRCRLDRDYTVSSSERLLEPSSSLLVDRLLDRRALVVTTPTVARLYGERLDALVSRHHLSVKTMVLPCSERGKSLERVRDICDAALGCGLDRHGLLVALGGGVCFDLVTLAASLIR